jgi:hypothetical protein
MAYNTGVNDKVNGGVQAGEFLTGNMDFFTVATVVPVVNSQGWATNVTTPVNLLYTQQGYTTWQPVTVVDQGGNPVTYNTQAAYVDAYNIQQNFNTLVQLFSMRANPVAISTAVVSVTNPHTTTLFAGFLNNSGVFGSNYTNNPTLIYVVKIATEHTLLWNVSSAMDSNDDGYQLLNSLQGVPVNDLASPVLQTDVFETMDSGNCNTLAKVGFYLG